MPRSSTIQPWELQPAIQRASLNGHGDGALFATAHLENLEFDPEPLTADMYGVAITSLIRDVRKAVLQRENRGLRIMKAMVAVLVLWTTIAMQVFLIFEFKSLMTQSAVHKIRTTYGEYEAWMYSNHTTLTTLGFQRGVAGFFDEERFETLPPSVSPGSSFPYSWSGA